MVTLDEHGELVRDALLWNDNRSAPDAADLIAELGGPQAWADAVGSVPVSSMTVSKIRWLARAEPENAARTAGVVLPHDWLTWQIGGRSFAPDHRPRRRLGHLLLRRHDQRVPPRPGPAGHRSRPGPASGGRPARDRRPDTRRASRSRRGRATTWPPASGSTSPPARPWSRLGTSGTAFTRSAQQTHEPTGTVAGFADATGRVPAAGLHPERRPQPGGHRRAARRQPGRPGPAGPERTGRQ